jgi:hypothetical protein
MKTVLWQALREWERSILWVSVAGLSLVVVFLLGRLAADKEPSQARLQPVHAPPSYLNEDTAYDFLQPLQAPDANARNPFAFSCKMPEPKNAVLPAPPPTGDGSKVSGPAQTGPASGNSTEVTPPKDPPPPPPPPPKRTASVLYRGLYRSGPDGARQLAFLSTHEAPGDVTGTAVLAPGQSQGGITVKRCTPAELVVAGPSGVEVTIAVGAQAQIALE